MSYLQEYSKPSHDNPVANLVMIHLVPDIVGGVKSLISVETAEARGKASMATSMAQMQEATLKEMQDLAPKRKELEEKRMLADELEYDLRIAKARAEIALLTPRVTTGTT